MWFGNMVTMKWWNDLWLNESFADFVCYLASSETQPTMDFDTFDSWQSFLKRKDWGYLEDQRSTTHPISVEVPNTSMAESIFDGITYSKGASVLKQLYFLIGRERFSDNVANYFKKYMWSNTTLKDFLDEISGGCGEENGKELDMKFFN